MRIEAVIDEGKVWLRSQMGPSWFAFIGFLALSGLIGFFANLRALIELFTLLLMVVYQVTDPILSGPLAAAGIDNKNHLASNLILYIAASLGLTLAFAVMRRARNLRLLRAMEAARALRRAQDQAERTIDDEEDGSSALGGAIAGGLLGVGLGLLFGPIIAPVALLGAAIGGLAGAASDDDERTVGRAVVQVATPTLEEQRQTRRTATRMSVRVFLSTLLKAALICGLIALLTYERSRGWNAAMEMELRTELAMAKVACELQPKGTYVVQLEPIDAPETQCQRNYCVDELRARRTELKKHQERREQAEALRAARAR